MLRKSRRDFNIAISMIYCELNLLSNVETMLEQRCNFDVVASTSLHRYVVVVERCDLPTTLSQHCVFAGTCHPAEVFPFSLLKPLMFFQMGII